MLKRLKSSTNCVQFKYKNISILFEQFYESNDR